MSTYFKVIVTINTLCILFLAYSGYQKSVLIESLIKYERDSRMEIWSDVKEQALVLDRFEVMESKVICEDNGGTYNGPTYTKKQTECSGNVCMTSGGMSTPTCTKNSVEYTKYDDLKWSLNDTKVLR